MAGAEPTSELLAIRGVRRDPPCAPGGERFVEVLRRHIPLVYGQALALIPENPGVAVSVTLAAFEALVWRWRKLSRRTVLATWLVRTVWYAAMRERRRLGLASRPSTVEGVISYTLLKQINRLNARQANAFVLAVMLGEPIERVAGVLRSKPRRIEKRVAKAAAKVEKRFRKLKRKVGNAMEPTPPHEPDFRFEVPGFQDAPFPLTPALSLGEREPRRPVQGSNARIVGWWNSHPGPLPAGDGEAVAASGENKTLASTFLKMIPTTPPVEVEGAIVTQAGTWRTQKPWRFWRTREARSDGVGVSDLARATIRAWRWRKAGIWIRRWAVVSGVLALIGASGFGCFVYLWEQGYLHLPFLQWYQFKMVKRFPGMATPARPWPGTGAAMANSAQVSPTHPTELYGLTNIWLAKIRMTRKQWRAMQPLHVRPMPHLWEEGRVKLQNPHASRNGLAGALGLDLPWSEGAFEFAGQSLERVGVRFRGNGSYVAALNLNKKSYKVDLNRVEKGRRVAGVSTLNFLNELPDFSYLRDPLAQQLFRELGAIAPRTAYAYLTIDVPGELMNQPLGLYVMVEDINSDFAKHRFGSKAVPIFKPVTYDLFEDWGKDWKDYEGAYDLKTKATDEQLARVIEFAELVTHADDKQFARKLPEYLDLEEYAAFVAGHALLSSYDGYFTDGQNFYFYLDPHSNKFGFIPWDQDVAWGAFSYLGTAEARERASIWKPAAYDNRFLKRVMKVEAFRKIYRRKLEEALAGPFSVERLNREIDRVAAMIRPAIAAESEFRRERFETSISTNWAKGPRDGRRGDDTIFGPGAPAHQIKRFIEARAKSVREQLDGKSEGARIAGFGD